MDKQEEKCEEVFVTSRLKRASSYKMLIDNFLQLDVNNSGMYHRDYRIEMDRLHPFRDLEYKIQQRSVIDAQNKNNNKNKNKTLKIAATGSTVTTTGRRKVDSIVFRRYDRNTMYEVCIRTCDIPDDKFVSIDNGEATGNTILYIAKHQARVNKSRLFRIFNPEGNKYLCYQFKNQGDANWTSDQFKEMSVKDILSKGQDLQGSLTIIITVHTKDVLNDDEEDMD